MDGKVAWGVRQNIAGHCWQIFEIKTFVDITQQCFALLPKVNFSTNNLNFHWRWRWWDQIQAIFLNSFYFTYVRVKYEFLKKYTAHCTVALYFGSFHVKLMNNHRKFFICKSQTWFAKSWAMRQCLFFAAETVHTSIF